MVSRFEATILNFSRNNDDPMAVTFATGGGYYRRFLLVPFNRLHEFTQVVTGQNKPALMSIIGRNVILIVEDDTIIGVEQANELFTVTK